MRRLSVFLSAVAFVVGVSSQAGAGVLTLASGTLGLTLGALPPLSTPLNGPVAITVSSGAGSFTEPASVFGPATVPIPKSFFSGVPQISGLTIAFSNGVKVVNGAAGTALGGLVGTASVNILQLKNLSIPLSAVGASGTAFNGAGGILITVFGQGWTTGVATVMGVSISTITPGTAFNIVHTVTVATGSDNRTPGHRGMMTLVSGFQVATSVAGNLAGFAIQKLIFTPAPGALLLLGGGVVGLGVYGCRRMRG